MFNSCLLHQMSIVAIFFSLYFQITYKSTNHAPHLIKIAQYRFLLFYKYIMQGNKSVFGAISEYIRLEREKT